MSTENQREADAEFERSAELADLRARLEAAEAQVSGLRNQLEATQEVERKHAKAIEGLYAQLETEWSRAKHIEERAIAIAIEKDDLACQLATVTRERDEARWLLEGARADAQNMRGIVVAAESRVAEAVGQAKWWASEAQQWAETSDNRVAEARRLLLTVADCEPVKPALHRKILAFLFPERATSASPVAPGPTRESGPVCLCGCPAADHIGPSPFYTCSRSATCGCLSWSHGGAPAAPVAVPPVHDELCDSLLSQSKPCNCDVASDAPVVAVPPVPQFMAVQFSGAGYQIVPTQPVPRPGEAPDLDALHREGKALGREMAERMAPMLSPTPAGPGEALLGPKASLRHDAGAYARCSFCKRYSMDPRTLDRRAPKCECGSADGWSGSFVAPGPDAKWSGPPPAPTPAPSVVTAEELAAASAEATRRRVLFGWDKDGGPAPSVEPAAGDVTRHETVDFVMAKVSRHQLLSDYEAFVLAREVSSLRRLAPATPAEPVREVRLLPGDDTPWPIVSVLEVLANAANHLLGQHACDDHGHEETRAAEQSARGLIVALESRAAPPPAVREALTDLANDLIRGFDCLCFVDDLPDGEDCPCEGEGRVETNGGTRAGIDETETCWNCQAKAAITADRTSRGGMP